MPSRIRKHCGFINYGASGTHRAYVAHGPLGTN